MISKDWFTCEQRWLRIKNALQIGERFCMESLILSGQILVKCHHFGFGVEVGDIHLVGHGAGEGFGDAAPHDHLVAVLMHDFVVIQLIVLAVTAAVEGAVVGVADGLGVSCRCGRRIQVALEPRIRRFLLEVQDHLT